jgi:putative oxidoreductase
MKIAAIIIRTLMGLLFVFSSAVFFFNLIPVPPMEGKLKLFNEGLAASGYFMPFLKFVELICGLVLISGRFVTLIAVVIVPITINILLVHIFLAPEGLPVSGLYVPR